MCFSQHPSLFCSCSYSLLRYLHSIFSIFFTFHFIIYSKSEKKLWYEFIWSFVCYARIKCKRFTLAYIALCCLCVCVCVCGAECVSASTFVCVFMAIVCYRSNCVKRIKVEIHWRIYFIFCPVPWIICIGQCLVFHLALSTRHLSRSLYTRCFIAL